MKHLWIATVKSGNETYYYAHKLRWQAGSNATRYTRDDVFTSHLRFVFGVCVGMLVGIGLGMLV